MSDITLILLAAGNSTRMGSPKQLLPFFGQPLICHAARTAILAGCSPVIVVLGANEAPIRRVLEGLAVETVVNERWAEGMGTSIQSGLCRLEKCANQGEVQGAILALADQPFVSPEYLRQLAIDQRESGRAIVASQYSGTVGVPALFMREAFPLLMSLKPAEGCKGVILGNMHDVLLVDCAEAAIDVDTPEEYAALSRLA